MDATHDKDGMSDLAHFSYLPIHETVGVSQGMGTRSSKKLLKLKKDRMSIEMEIIKKNILNSIYNKLRTRSRMTNKVQRT